MPLEFKVRPEPDTFDPPVSAKVTVSPSGSEAASVKCVPVANSSTVPKLPAAVENAGALSTLIWSSNCAALLELVFVTFTS